MKYWIRALLLCLLAFASAGAANAQGRWELGNPSIHIDLPGQPAGTGVTWAERNTWAVTPGAWRAEGGGLAVEVAKLYGTRSSQTLEDLLAGIEAKTGAAGAREQGEVSGRAFLLAQNENRLVAAIEPSPGVGGSTAWGVVISYAGAAAAPAARAVWTSIELEREGAFRPAMRGLGPTKLVAELPYELTPALRSAGPNQRRYEATWDSMSIDVAVDQASGDPNMRWDTKTSINKYIDDLRGRPGVSNFKAERTGIKFGKMTGDLATVTFKQGTREYKNWKVATFSGNEGYSIEFSIDPRRAEQTLTVGRALETIRTTDIPMWGWKPYTLGAVTVEAPMTFKQTKQADGLTEWESAAAAMPLTVREVVLPPGVATDPDAASAQAVQVFKLLPGMASAQHAGTEKRIVDGLPARLVRMTWKNAGFNNLRSHLYIYGATRTWVVDVIAADNYKDWHNRVFDTVRVRVPESGAMRQRIGAMNASFNLGSTAMQVTKMPPPAAAIKSVEQAIVQLPAGGVAAIVDQTTAEDGQVMKPQATSFYESFSKPLNAPPPTEVIPVALDGARGFHVRGKATAQGVLKDTDFVMLARGKGLLILFLLTDPNSADRAVKDELLNSLRLGTY